MAGFGDPAIRGAYDTPPEGPCSPNTQKANGFVFKKTTTKGPHLGSWKKHFQATFIRVCTVASCSCWGGSHYGTQKINASNQLARTTTHQHPRWEGKCAGEPRDLPTTDLFYCCMYSMLYSIQQIYIVGGQMLGSKTPVNPGEPPPRWKPPGANAWMGEWAAERGWSTGRRFGRLPVCLGAAFVSGDFKRVWSLIFYLCTLPKESTGVHVKNTLKKHSVLGNAHSLGTYTPQIWVTTTKTVNLTTEFHWWT